jgi:hypothetical protein
MFNNPTINKAEYYSFGHIYRRWSRLNKCFPLLLNGAHGIVKGPIEREHFNLYFPYFVAHNRRIYEKTRTLDFRVIKSPHPFVLFKLLESIEKTKAKDGGVYFLSHSISGLHVDYKTDEIVRDLRKAEKLVGNITICVYYLDWQVWGEFFENMGFKTICLGVPMDDSFVYNLYDLLSQNAFILDDSLGSHVFYGIDFGLKIWRFREADDYKINRINELHDEIFVSKMELLFPVTKEPVITNEQIVFVREEMGYDFFDNRRYYFKLKLVWATTITLFSLLKKGFYS